LNTQTPREKVILAGLDATASGRRNRTEDPSIDIEESIQELGTLATSAGAEVLETVLQSRQRPDAATLVGSGKVEELKGLVRLHEADAVIFDNELSPTQQRNLENGLDTKVLDRTQLILDIFARRARTREGQLQVELAQLNYMLPRLTGRGVEMSRLGGGIGTRGPGETQLETDRRRINRRIKQIESDLEKVRSHRSTQRRQRQAVPLATVALVGYTNAGKSTLFNALTGAGVTADARMFATLDPTVRHIVLPSNRRVLLSDTVGFIRNLPTTLVEAFRATLEEVTEAELLLHVVDIASPHAAEQTERVFKVLAEIGASETPQILVLNKTDLLPESDRMNPRIAAQRILGGVQDRHPENIATVSARTCSGFDGLIESIDQALGVDPVARVWFRFPIGEGAQLSMVHEYAKVLSIDYGPEFTDVEADAPESIRRRLSGYLAEGPGA
jgi:GTP-binding protein HflX